jgi:cation-transporting ATPase E
MESKEKNRTEIKGFPKTAFTERTRGEVARYKRMYDKVWGKTPPVEPERYKPTAERGLSVKQVEDRIDACLVNYVKKGSTKTVGGILFTNIFTFYNLLALFVAGILIYDMVILEDEKMGISNLLFLAIFTANMLIGIIQELKAKYTIERLSVVAGSKVTVIRDGDEYVLVPDDIVLDDVVLLSMGGQIQADGVLLDGVVEVNESLLTGESAPVQKKKGDVLFAGSFVVSGTGRYRVDKVGKESYIQTMAKNASRYIRPRSELLSALRSIIKSVGGIIIILGAILVFTQLADVLTSEMHLNNAELSELIRQTSGAIVGMIPAGMFLLTSLALAVGVINLAKSNTLVQELYCIEMLARVDTLCLDKTGTITDGTMKVADVIEIKSGSKKNTLREIISSMLYALNDNNQTAVALGDYFGRECIIKAKDLLPFSSARKLSAVTFMGAGIGTYIMGAPEFIFANMSEKLGDIIARFASQGYRVLALGYSAGKLDGDRLPNNIIPAALITLQDSIRREAPQTVKWFRENGVDIRVISGDNPITVSEVARRVGIEGAEKYVSLAGMSITEVRAVAREYTVFGRVTPEQKLILIKELKNSGRTVAMTGDGVNDILALREADCSIAMAAGSEAARNVSHLVLLDSNFSSMPKVVLEGRRVINNVQRTSSLFLFKTLFTILLTVLCIFTNGGVYFFDTSNLLILEAFVIGIPAFALALERNSTQIKGKFLVNILKNSFSGAVVVLINMCVLTFFLNNGIFAITDNIFTTMCIYATLLTGFAMLYKITQPLNVYRTVILLLMFGCYFISIFYFKSDFNIELLSNDTHLLLAILMLFTSYALMAVVNNTLSKMHLVIEDKPVQNVLDNKGKKY